jgi:hypothetical protein
MKNLFSMAAVLCAAGLALTAHDVFAGATLGGANCVGLLGAQATYGTQAAANFTSSAFTMNCPIDVDHQLPSTTVNFRARVSDNSTTEGFSCTGFVHDQNGVQIGATSARTTSVAGTGSSTLPSAGTWTATISTTQANTHIYSIQCSTPGNQSSIATVRAF